MRTKSRYHEASLIERALPPIGKLVAWTDAYFLLFWTRVLTFADRVVEKEAVMEGTFFLSGLTGMMFVIMAVAQKPELGFTKQDTFKSCAAIMLAVMLLRFLCALSVKRMKSYSINAVEVALGSLQPTRSVSTISLLILGGYEWYRYNYFFLALATLFAVLGIYTHTATIYLQIKAKVDQAAKIQELKSKR